MLINCLTGTPAVAKRVLWIMESPSIRETQHGVRSSFGVVRDTPRIFEKIISAQKSKKMGQTCVKKRVFEISCKIKLLIFSQIFLSFFIYNEIYLYFCLNPIFGKNLVPEIRSKQSHAMRLQDFEINYISRTEWLKAWFFFMLKQVHEN